jgi:hypothetical protein
VVAPGAAEVLHDGPLEPGSFVLDVARPGRQSDSWIVLVTAAGQPPVLREVTRPGPRVRLGEPLAPGQTETLKLRVLRDGDRIAGARVVWCPTMRGVAPVVSRLVVAETRTDEHGEASIPLAAGTKVNVRIESPRGRKRLVALGASGGATQRIELEDPPAPAVGPAPAPFTVPPPPGRRWLRVLTAETERFPEDWTPPGGGSCCVARPLPGRIRVRPGSGGPWKEVYQPGRDGFRIALAPGTWEIEAAGDLGALTRRRVDLGAEDDVEIRIPLETGSGIRVAVLDADGRPVGPVPVVVTDAAGTPVETALEVASPESDASADTWPWPERGLRHEAVSAGDRLLLPVGGEWRVTVRLPDGTAREATVRTWRGLVTCVEIGGPTGQ